MQLTHLSTPQQHNLSNTDIDTQSHFSVNLIYHINQGMGVDVGNYIKVINLEHETDRSLHAHVCFN